MKKSTIKQMLFCIIYLFSNIASSAEFADVIYSNGAVWTGTSTNQDASSIAIKNGTIIAVGSSKNLKTIIGSNTKLVDLKGSFIMPGFIDNHVHFFEGGFALASVDLRTANSPQEFSKRIAEYSEKNQKGKWILNGNWDHENWGGLLPNKSWIDDSTQDKPVFVIRLDGLWH